MGGRRASMEAWDRRSSLPLCWHNQAKHQQMTVECRTANSCWCDAFEAGSMNENNQTIYSWLASTLTGLSGQSLSSCFTQPNGDRNVFSSQWLVETNRNTVVFPEPANRLLLCYVYRHRCHQYAVTTKHSHWLTGGTYHIASQSESTISLPTMSTSFGPITKCSIHTMCRTMHTFTSMSPIYDISNIHCAVVQNNPSSVVFLAKTKAIHQILQIL
jgi:hypothetical protein